MEVNSTYIVHQHQRARHISHEVKELQIDFKLRRECPNEINEVDTELQKRERQQNSIKTLQRYRRLASSSACLRHAPLQPSPHIQSPMGHPQDPEQHCNRGILINPAALAAASFSNTIRGYMVRFVGSSVDIRGGGGAGGGGKDDTEGICGNESCWESWSGRRSSDVGSRECVDVDGLLYEERAGDEK
jgi:hypothetical protein